MSACAILDPGDLELHFYGELDERADARVAAHLRGCAACRRHLDELAAISAALSSHPLVNAPAGSDWQPFMQRLDEQTVGRRRRLARWSAEAWALAAMLALVAIGAYIAVETGRLRASRTPDAARAAAAAPAAAAQSPEKALREVAAEHLERSKLVVLGLATRDPRHATPEDWAYERRLAGALLSDTRLYRRAAQDKGMADVARVLNDLETVLLEASMSDGSDRDALARVQRLISRRDLVVKMQVVAGSAGI